MCSEKWQCSPVVHVLGVADVDVAAVLLGGSRTAPSRKRRDEISGDIGQAVEKPRGSENKQNS